MSASTGRILLVEDDLSMARFLTQGLSRRGFEVTACHEGAAALETLSHADFDVVLTDLNMHGMSGLELCGRIVGNRPDIPVVLVTAFGSLDTAVSAIRAGAYDFLTKPIEIEALVLALNRATTHKSLQAEVKRLRHAVAANTGSTQMIGESRAMRALQELILRVSDSEASVLVSGESGTGKEVVARALHAQSRRRNGPFVAINCAAVPEALLESELFGHARGAFTDARHERLGLFMQANGGTLLLDEIGELPLGLQPKLLRALQERVVRPIGGSEVPFDARLIAATNRDLEQMVEEGHFREDLFFRVNVIRIDVPSLRERGNDVLLLAQRFLEDYAARAGKTIHTLTPEVAAKLVAYSWPGNVRELQNCVERAVALAQFDHLAVDDLPARVQAYRAEGLPGIVEEGSPLVPLAEVERRYIAKVLEAVSGNRTNAAKVLGLDRKTLGRKLGRREQ